MSLWSRLSNVFGSGRVERDLDDELRFHMEERARELVDSGMTPEAAAREVARRFGNRAALRERSRDVKVAPWLDSLVRDVRLGFRRLRKDGVVTSAAVVSLGLALGACLAAFSLVNALILRPLPVDQPEQLVYLTFPTYTPERPEADTFSYPLFQRLRDGSRGSADLFAMEWQVIRPAVFDGTGSARERIRAQHVSGDAFLRLGVSPAAGRLIAPQDDEQPGTHPVAVLSHAFWMRRFGGDPAVIGRWFALDDKQLQIVGVAEPRFTGVEPGRPTDVWLPMMMYDAGSLTNRSRTWLRIFGRVSDAAERMQAASILQTTFADFRRTHEFEPGTSPEDIARFVNTPLHLRSAATGPSPLRSQFQQPLTILTITALLILFIAGSNVANLLLARTAAREREMSLRLSIGSGRGRLIQQVLVESALIAVMACALGLLVARAAAPTIVTMLASNNDPIFLDLGVDWRLIAFAGGLVLLIAAAFGLVPALRASHVAPITMLRDGDRRAGTRASAMRPFVALQVALSLAVLFVGGLLVLSFVRLSQVNPGFAASNVLLFSLEATERVEAQQQRTTLLQVLDRLRAVPGVDDVGAAEINVLGRGWTHNIRLPGTEREWLEVNMKPVTDGFFETMGISRIDGRTFSRTDVSAITPNTVVVDETFARRYFGQEAAVGRTFEGRFTNDPSVQNEIIGVVASTKQDFRQPAMPTIYIPVQAGGSLYVRTAGAFDGMASRLRSEIQAASSLFRVTSITPQSSFVAQTLIRERLLALLAGFFAIVGIVLTAVGLYGVLNYSVGQRTREIGIRMALGAQSLGVVRTVLTDAGATTLVGVVCGLAAGLYLSRFVESLLFEVTALDLWSLALPLGVLLTAATIAAVLPAWRATRVDPVVALRHE